MIKKRSRIDQSEEARLERLASLRLKTGKKLSALSISYLNSENLSGNIENFIGSTSLPLGLSGPLKIHFEKSSEDISAGFATSEGALVSSITRGVLALNLAGGVRARCIENTVTRAPVFLFSELNQAVHFSKWLPNQILDLKQKTKEHSKHAVLVDLQIKVIINEVHVVFVFSTGEAAGQNMTTMITASLVQTIRHQYLNAESYWIEETRIEGNVSSDKKVSGMLFSTGRGRKVIVEAKISEAVVKKIFKVSAEQLCKNFNRMKTARVFAGYQGFNINVSNVVAALFLATGQDAACIHESSVAELHLEIQGANLFASLFMPSLIVGTIGGGTHLPHAQSCLELMSCEGSESANKLAEIICSFALALELSTVSAIESGHFVQAHSSLGRDGKKNFRPDDLDTNFLNSIAVDPEFHFESTSKIEAVDFDDAMMIDLASISARRISGLFRIQAKMSKSPNTKNYILKIKNSDSDLIASSQFMLQNLGLENIAQMDEFKKFHPFLNSQKNEIDINQFLFQQRFEFVPSILVSKISQDVGFLLTEEILNANKKFSAWTNSEIARALKNLQTIHNSEVSGIKIPSQVIKYQDSKSLWIQLAKSLMIRKTLTSSSAIHIFDYGIKNYDTIFNGIENLETRFCHLDYNPRNLLFSSTQIYVIDWEFAGLHLPQRDVVEFLIFQMSDLSKNEVKKILNNYCADIQYSSVDWNSGLKMAFYDFVLRRLSLYIVISEFKEIHFLNQIIENCSLFLGLILESEL